MSFLTNLLNTLKADALSIWSRFSGAMNIILGELPDAEIGILHGAFQTAGDKLAAGGSAEEAMTAALNYIETQELKELSKVGKALLDAFIAATDNKTEQ